MSLATKRIFHIALLSFLPILAIGVAFVLWDASRVLRHTAERIASESEIRFTEVRLEATIPAWIESISTPSAFSDAAQFQGHLYICGPTGLFEYDLNGALLRRFRVGLELPAAPLVSISTATLASGSEPELLAVTSGEGLLTFDGRRFRQIRPEGAGYRKLTAVLPLASGRVLLGTEKMGVVLYDGKQIVPFHPLLSNLHITALAGDDASVWVGTVDQGLRHWQAGRVRDFGHPEVLPDPRILSLSVSGDATYAGTPMGVTEFRSGRFVRTLGSGFFARTLLVRGDELLIGTLEEGVLEVPLTARPSRAPRPQPETTEEPVQRLFELEGSAYLLSETGLYTADEREGGWRQVFRREGALLTELNISALEVDSAGKLWVGYFDRGLDIVEPGGERASHLENEQLFCVNRIVHDRERGYTFVATANGLIILDTAGRQRQALGRSEGLIADHVTDIAVRPESVTLATPAGLTFIESGSMRSLYAFHGLVNNHVYALAASGDRLLAGTLGGLSVLDGGVVRASYTAGNSGLKHNWITAIVSAGDEWFVGTYGGGIVRLDTSGHWRSFPDLDPRFEVNPNAMIATDSHIYAGTLQRGLYVYDRTAARWFPVMSGLPSANVTALAAHRGYVYIGTDNGLVRIHESSLPTP